jgi:ABC-2 type transport system permease protein|nr:ABC transporter permease [Thermotoga neapolitana]
MNVRTVTVWAFATPNVIMFHGGSEFSSGGEGHLKLLIKTLYFIRKDILIWLSYRTQLVLGLLSGFVGIVQFGFIGKFIAQGNYFPLIERYGGDILAYFITGSVFMSYTNLALMTFKGVIQREQSMGTLEYILLSKTPLWQLFLFSFVSSFFFTTLNITLIFLGLVYLFSVHITPNFLEALVVLFTVMLPLMGIGLLSASIVLVTKRGDPVGWLYTTLSGLFSGIYFPVEILPDWIRPVSYLIPSTYGIDLLRRVLMRGEHLSSVSEGLVLLAATGTVLISAGIVAFKRSFNQARLRGSLSWY